MKQRLVSISIFISLLASLGISIANPAAADSAPSSLSVPYTDSDTSKKYTINLKQSKSQSDDFEVKLGNHRNPGDNTELATYLGSVDGDSGGFASAVYELGKPGPRGSGLLGNMYVDLVLGNGKETILKYDRNTKETYVESTLRGHPDEDDLDYKSKKPFWKTLPSLDTKIDGIYTAKISYDISSEFLKWVLIVDVLFLHFKIIISR